MSEATKIDGDARARAHPETWAMPPVEARMNVRAGQFVKVGWLFEDGSGERIWYRVVKVVEPGLYEAVLANTPLGPCPKETAVLAREVLDVLDPVPES